MTEDRNRLGDVFDAHTAAEFQTKDIAATMATMSGTPHVTHVPVMTGGHGREAVRSSTTPGSSAIGPMTLWSGRFRAPSA